MNGRLARTLIGGCAALFLTCSAQAQVIVGQQDDFENGTTMSWTAGAIIPNRPVNVSSGGPLGSDDNYLRISALGGGGAGSRLIAFNQTQWTGDYLAAGVTSFETDLLNLSGTELSIRVALQGSGTRYASTVGFTLPADGLWHAATFALDSDSLSIVVGSGSGSLETVLATVNELRLLHNTSPDWVGEAIDASFGVDNFTAVPEPGEWAMVLGGLALILVSVLRRLSGFGN